MDRLIGCTAFLTEGQSSIKTSSIILKRKCDQQFILSRQIKSHSWRQFMTFWAKNWHCYGWQFLPIFPINRDAKQLLALSGDSWWCVIIHLTEIFKRPHQELEGRCQKLQKFCKRGRELGTGTVGSATRFARSTLFGDKPVKTQESGRTI